MRLYRHPMSACSFRTMLTIHELGITDRIELVLVDLSRGEQRAPDYLALNPNGKVPTLDDDGFILWESHAIMQYLADAVPGQTLYPEARKPRADVKRWMFWNASHFAPAMSILRRERVVKKLMGMGEPDPAEVARGEGLLRQFAGVLDAHLQGKTWIVGDQLSLADLAIAAELQNIEVARPSLDASRNVLDWLGRLRERPSWASASR